VVWLFRDRSNDKLTFKEQWEVVKQGYDRGVHYDGCSGVPDLDFGADCCGEHDAHYQLGTLSRAEADKRLRECMRAKGYFLLPWVYWMGVRVFGRNYYRKKQDEGIDVDLSAPAPNSVQPDERA
jgi:hypothetical protein